MRLKELFNSPAFRKSAAACMAAFTLASMSGCSASLMRRMERSAERSIHRGADRQIRAIGDSIFGDPRREAREEARAEKEAYKRAVDARNRAMKKADKADDLFANCVEKGKMTLEECEKARNSYLNRSPTR